MIVKRKDKESNYALLRKFTRELLLDGKIALVKERQFFKKSPNRRQLRLSAAKREEIRESYQTY